MQIEHLHVSTLIPYANNAREHSEEQVSQIAASIKEFKFNNPVLVDKTHGIVAGHGRVLAAKKLGLETVPCIRLDHLSEIQKKAYILADNKLTLNSKWNPELLHLELETITESDLDINILGFNDLEIQTVLSEELEILDESEKIDDFQFVIKCDSVKELENIQNKFNTKSKKIKYQTFNEHFNN